MPKDESLKKVLVIGSGPIVIGQAAEFDYAGTQACHALREEGVEVVLINSNPATIMTDTHIADQVYIEPLTVEFVTQVIRKERPDGLLPTLGGQTGLNLAVELAQQGVLAREKVQLLGTDLETIQQAEDREQFRRLMREINEPTPESVIAHTLEEALHFAEKIGYPLIIRPAYTLGGTGGGIANDEGELREIVENGLRYSPIGQCLIERSIAGWKEIELEVVRDGVGQAIVVCAMENLDPVGVHTGDSIVFAPCQTLKEHQYQMLRTSALRIVQALSLRGGCNVQYALDPTSDQYHVIEVNPRVSRSSALASKATGYPIAKVAAKVALGFRLDELSHPETGKFYASIEPQMKHIVCKIPRWPFDKFTLANRRLGTQMKATGEVMAIGSSLEESLLKAVRSLELDVDDFLLSRASFLSEQELKKRLQQPDDERLFLLAEGFRRGMAIEELHDLTRIDPYFLDKIAGIVAMEQNLSTSDRWNREQLLAAKKMGFTDRTIAALVGEEEATIRKQRLEAGICPVFKKVDTSTVKGNAETPYFYSTYEGQGEKIQPREKPCVVVLGSGPIRIGQGVEFDYATVHAVEALQAMGIEAVIINNNPESSSSLISQPWVIGSSAPGSNSVTDSSGSPSSASIACTRRCSGDRTPTVFLPRVQSRRGTSRVAGRMNVYGPAWPPSPRGTPRCRVHQLAELGEVPAHQREVVPVVELADPRPGRRPRGRRPGNPARSRSRSGRRPARRRGPGRRSARSRAVAGPRG